MRILLTEGELFAGLTKNRNAQYWCTHLERCSELKQNRNKKFELIRLCFKAKFWQANIKTNSNKTGYKNTNTGYNSRKSHIIFYI